MNNPSIAWRQLLPNYNELYTIDSWRNLVHQSSWDNGNTFDALLPKFQEERSKSSDFYKRFNYGWTLCKESYENQSEVLYQYIALAAIKGLWYSAPDNELSNPKFDNLCVRVVQRNGLKNNSPCIVKPFPFRNWRFIRTTSAWFDFSALACDAFCLGVGAPFNIDSFDGKRHSIDLSVVTPLWNVLIINGLISSSNCHEILRPELAERLAKTYETSTIPKTNTKPNRPTDRLNEFSLRFTIAHEVGHHLEDIFTNVRETKGVFDSDHALHSELLADSLALHGVRAYKWGDLHNDTYAPLLNDSSNVPIIAGQTFYFVLGMWITAENAVGKQLGESETVRSKRSAHYKSRIMNWQRSLDSSRYNITKQLDEFFTTLLDHMIAFESHAESEMPRITRRFKNLDQRIMAEHRQTNSLIEVEDWIVEQLKTNVDH